MQRRIASWIASKQGVGAWKGFKIHPNERISATMALKSWMDFDQNVVTLFENVPPCFTNMLNNASRTGESK